MNSAGYTSDTCPKCLQHGWCRGSKVNVYQQATWVYSWAGERVQDRYTMGFKVGTCYGCSNVALLHCMVLASVLCKLGIRVKGFSSEYTAEEAIVEVMRRNRLDMNGLNFKLAMD